MDLRIVRAEPEDWEAYADIRLRSLLAAPEAFGSSHEREVGFEPEVWQERIASAWTYLAYVNGLDAPIGTVTGLWRRNGDTQVVAMYVDPAARGQRVAHRLLDRIAALARQRGGTRLVLDVTDLNPVATRSYTAYGFVETGHRRPMPRDSGLTEIQLAYDL